MNTKDIEYIWTQQDESKIFEDLLTLNEISERTMTFTSDRVSSGQRTVRFDTIYKGIVIAANLLLMVMGDLSLPTLAVSVFILTCLIYLIYRNRTLYGSFGSIDDAKPVIKVLQQRYEMLNRFYREFLISSSVTHALFVFTGFRLYHFFRYGEGQFRDTISDPVIGVFLLLAFIIPFLAQRRIYSRLMTEMKEILEPDLDEAEQELRTIEIQSKDQARKLVYITVALLGLALLFTLITLFS